MRAPRLLLFVSALGLPASLAAQSALPFSLAAAGRRPAVAKFDLDAGHSAVEFKIRFMGLSNVRGRFAEFGGTIMYVDDDVTRSTVNVVIKASSIDTDNEFRDKDLRETFFEAEKYPLITFRSTRIERTPAGFVAHGPLTIKGVTKEVALPFVQLHGRAKDAWENVRIGFEAALTIDRKDFGVAGRPFWNQMFDLDRLAVADSVRIELGVQAARFNFVRRGFMGQGKPPIGAKLLATIEQQGVAAAVTEYATLKASQADQFNFDETQLNTLGYKLLEQGKTKEAIEIFQLNVTAYPQSANVYDSLAEAYASAGDLPNAIANYRKSLAIDPANVGAVEMLRWMEPAAN